MLSNPFTTQDGDVILRAGPEPDSKHDFRVHKVVLSLVSHVFKDLFLTARPDGGDGDPLPIVDITDPPENVDLLLRFVYPGLVLPTSTEPAKLSALLTIADKYDIRKIPLDVKRIFAGEEALKIDPFGVYTLARHWGFAEEAKGAARRMTLAKIRKSPFSKDPQSLANEDFFRLLWFMEKRGDEAKKTIRTFLVSWEKYDDPDGNTPCVLCHRHTGDQAREFFRYLAERIIMEFDLNPCLDDRDLARVFSRGPPPPNAGPCEEEGEEQDYFTVCCPLKQGNIVNDLDGLARRLESLCERYLEKAMDGEPPA